MIKTLFAFLLLFINFNAHSQSKMATVLSTTSLPLSCKVILLDLSERVIGPKEHRILKNPNPRSRSFEAFMLLSYNDQESHVHFSAVPTDNGCEVQYSESFEIDVPCLSAREALFKRWNIIGKLSDTTIVMRYDSPRNKRLLPKNKDDRASAYLTQTRNGEACLITKKQQNIQVQEKK